VSASVFARKLEEGKSGYKVERSVFYCRHHCSLLQLARCEERLGLVEQSLSSTQDQLSGRVSEVRNSDQLLLLLLFLREDWLLTGSLENYFVSLNPSYSELLESVI